MKKFIVVLLSIAALATPALGMGGSASAAPPGYRVCRQGDPPILASVHTSCAFAGRILDAYVNEGYPQVSYVYSPVTHRTYRIAYHRRGVYVIAAGPPRTEVWIRFYWPA